MNGAGSKRVDLRAFRWQLAPLEKKLNANVDAACIALAVIRQREASLQQAIGTLESQRDREMVAVAALAGTTVDPWVRASTLKYLARQGRQLGARQLEAAALRLEFEKARETCASWRRQLACVEKLRAGAQAAFATQQLRAVAKEADLGWLAAHARSGPRLAGGEA